MKIEAGGVSSSEIQTDWSARQTAASTSATQLQNQQGDRTTLSRDNVTVKSLVNQAMATSDVRQDKVSQLRQQVANGTYKVDTQQLATAIVESSTE